MLYCEKEEDWRSSVNAAQHPSEYGIEVLVKFREGERGRCLLYLLFLCLQSSLTLVSPSSADQAFQPLAYNTPSGGEKQTTAMFYLLAMQAVTPCPWRLVDEIK